MQNLSQWQTLYGTLFPDRSTVSGQTAFAEKSAPVPREITPQGPPTELTQAPPTTSAQAPPLSSVKPEHNGPSRREVVIFVVIVGIVLVGYVIYQDKKAAKQQREEQELQDRQS